MPKYALVTGAGGGIGFAVCQKLSTDGYVILGADVNFANLKKIESLISGSQGFSIDLSKITEIKNLKNKLTAANTMPELIVNAAGAFFTHSALTLSEAKYDLIMDVNVKSIFFIAQEFIPHMVQQKNGNIINIASTAGFRGGADRAIYSASKSAVISLTKSLALEFAKSGVRVNGVAPGLIDTPMANWISLRPDAINNFNQKLPAGRMGTPAEIAEVVSFLASEKSSYLHGSTIIADGGGTA